MCDTIINRYANFNADQIIPIFSDVNLAKTIITEMIKSLDEYIESLYNISTEIEQSRIISEETKINLDKNVMLTINDLNMIINKNVPFRNLGIKKEKLFERLKRGINYKFKLCNGSIVDNSELIKVDNVCVNTLHRMIEIGSENFQLCDSADYASTCPDLSMFLPITDENVEMEEIVNKVLCKIKKEVIKASTIQAHLDIVLSCITYFLDSIIVDINHFELFDPKLLNELN